MLTNSKGHYILRNDKNKISDENGRLIVQISAHSNF